MENKEVKIGEKVYNVHEMLATDFDSLSGIEDNVERMRILHTKSCDISVDDYNTLTLKERNLLTKAINEVNGWGTEEVIDIDKKKI